MGWRLGRGFRAPRTPRAPLDQGPVEVRGPLERTLRFAERLFEDVDEQLEDRSVPHGHGQVHGVAHRARRVPHPGGM